jgi:hypothetical protein
MLVFRRQLVLEVRGRGREIGPSSSLDICCRLQRQIAVQATAPGRAIAARIAVEPTAVGTTAEQPLPMMGDPSDPCRTGNSASSPRLD